MDELPQSAGASAGVDGPKRRGRPPKNQHDHLSAGEAEGVSPGHGGNGENGPDSDGVAAKRRAEGKGWADWLDDIEKIERREFPRKVVAASFPGGLPKVAHNVSNGISRTFSPEYGLMQDGIRSGVYGSFRVYDGDFTVQFSDGGLVHK